MQALLEILYTNNLSKSYKEPVRYTSAALCAVGTSVTLHYLRSLRDSVCPLYKPFNLSSIFRKNLLLPCYHVLNTLLPCLLLFCTMSYITLLPCLTLLCYHVSHYSVTMSLITLYHVFHYSAPCLPLPCLHQGMQNHKKRVDKLIIPRSHTPQNN